MHTSGHLSFHGWNYTSWRIVLSQCSEWIYITTTYYSEHLYIRLTVYSCLLSNQKEFSGRPLIWVEEEMAVWQKRTHGGCNNLLAYITYLSLQDLLETISLYNTPTCPWGVVGNEQFYDLMNHMKPCTLWAAQIVWSPSVSWLGIPGLSSKNQLFVREGIV